MRSQPAEQLKGATLVCQSRFTSQNNDWRPCSYEHHLRVVANPSEWPGYETRAFYIRADAAKTDAQPVAYDLEAAARKLAACMDYPWEHMPEQGRNQMRAHANSVIDAASSQKSEGV